MPRRLPGDRENGQNMGKSMENWGNIIGISWGKLWEYHGNIV